MKSSVTNWGAALLLLLAAATFGSLGPASAQNEYATPAGASQAAPLSVLGCLNASGRAVPANSTACGASNYHVIAAASDNHVVIKNGAGTVYDVDAENDGTTIQYVRLYNAGTGFNGCNSATGLVWGSPIPAAAVASGVGGSIVKSIPVGLAFTTGISICITGAVSDTDTTNAATTTIVNIGYK